MNKKLIYILLVVTFLGLGFQAYASQVLDSNIITVAKEKLAGLFSNSEKKVDEYFNDKQSEVEQDIVEHINQEDQDIEDSLNDNIDNKLNEANNELDQYVEQLKAEISALYEAQQQQAMNDIDRKIAEETLRIKLNLLELIEAMYR